MVGAQRSELPPLSHRDINLLLISSWEGEAVGATCPGGYRVADGMGSASSAPPLAYLCELYREHRFLANRPALPLSLALSGIGPTFILGRGHQGPSCFLLTRLRTVITRMHSILSVTLVSLSPSLLPFVLSFLIPHSLSQGVGGCAVN